MKLFALSLLSLASIAARAEAAPLLTCANIEMYQPGPNGQGKFLPSRTTVVIVADQDTEYGFRAEVSENGKAVVEKDTDVGAVMPGDAEGQRMKEMASGMAPQLKWEQVHHIRLTTVGVKASLHDGGGILIYEAFDQSQRALARLVTVGWAFGRCGK